MEYLMTYGSAILIIAVVLAALFELGVFTGVGSPQACVAQSGFICSGATYSSANGISFGFGQNTGLTFYSVNVFVASEASALSSAGVIGVPENLTDSGNTIVSANAVAIGTLSSGQIYTATFGGAGGNGPAQAKAGGLPSGSGSVPIGTAFYGYVWIAYCQAGPCVSGPTNWQKVATLAVKSSS